MDQSLWDKVKERQGAQRGTVVQTDRGYRLNAAHRRRFLLSGLLRCGVRGGSYTVVACDRYGRASHRNRGTCSNDATVVRQAIERRTLDGLKDRLMAPDLVAEFMRAYHAEVSRLNADREATYEASRRERETIQRRIAGILDGIERGVVTESTRDRLIELKARKKQIDAMPPPAPAPRLHPKLADLNRDKVARLHEALDRDDARAEAAEALRALINEVRLTPEIRHRWNDPSRRALRRDRDHRRYRTGRQRKTPRGRAIGESTLVGCGGRI